MEINPSTHQECKVHTGITYDTQTQSEPFASDNSSFSSRGLIEVDALLGMSLRQLQVLYEDARCPELSAISGECKGRMLAVTGWGNRFPLHGMLHSFASTGIFPWKGKNFTPLSEVDGEGINRTLSNRFPLQLFGFTTSIDKSLHDYQPAYILDYDQPKNPGFIRRIRDEIRQISSEVFLGQAWLKVSDSYHLALYFGLELPK